MGQTGSFGDYVVVRGGQRQRERFGIPTETRVALILNGRPWVTLACSPAAFRELALGYAYFAGAIGAMDDVLRVEEPPGDPATVSVTLRIAGSAEVPWLGECAAGGGPAPAIAVDDPWPTVPPAPPLLAADVVDAMRSLHDRSTMHRTAGGTHAAALGDGRTLLALYEDISRHNTIDKLAGHCLLNGLDSSGRVLFTSGRLSSELVGKAVRMRVSATVSRSTPTDMALALAAAAGLTVYGYARGEQLTVFCGEPPLA